MPQASAETDAAMKVYFGIETEDNQWEKEAYDYLHKLGIKDHGGMLYTDFESSKVLDKKAWAAINYLCQEWDYAWSVDPTPDQLGY